MLGGSLDATRRLHTETAGLGLRAAGPRRAERKLHSDHAGGEGRRPGSRRAPQRRRPPAPLPRDEVRRCRTSMAAWRDLLFSQLGPVCRGGRDWPGGGWRHPRRRGRAEGSREPTASAPHEVRGGRARAGDRVPSPGPSGPASELIGTAEQSEERRVCSAAR